MSRNEPARETTWNHEFCAYTLAQLRLFPSLTINEGAFLFTKIKSRRIYTRIHLPPLHNVLRHELRIRYGFRRLGVAKFQKEAGTVLRDYSKRSIGHRL